jgi:hypothetical protein
MRRSKFFVVGAIVGCIVIATFWAMASSAGAQGAPAAQQQTPPQRVSILITQVKPDMIDVFQSIIIKEGIPAEKKAGTAWRATYRPVLGEPNTFITVRPSPNYAQYDSPSYLERTLGAEGARRYLAKVGQAVVSQRRVIQTLVPNLSIESGMTAHANLLVVTEVTFVPGKAAEHAQLLTSQILPAYRKVGVKDYWVHNTNYGAPQHRTIVRPIANFAELDATQGLLVKALGAEAAQKINQQLAAITVTLENSVVRLVPELSYSTPPQRTSR